MGQPTQAQAVDQGFKVDVQSYGFTASMATLPSGHVVVLGSQQYTNGLLTGSLVRFLPTGELDKQFTQQAEPVAYGAELVNPYRPLVRAYPDGRLLLLGCTTPQVSTGLVRLLPSGQLDYSFRLPALTMLPTIRTAALQPDGKILLAGTANSYSGAPCLLRLNADGSPDPTFTAALGNAASDYVQALAVQPDGRILVAGRFARPATGLVRLLANGQYDSSFQPLIGGSSIVEEVLLRPDGRLVVAGLSTLVVRGQAGGLHQLLADGQLDPTFDPAPTAAYSLVRSGDNRRLHLLRGGRLGVLPLAPAPAVVFLLPTGQLDAARPPLVAWPLKNLTAATLDSAGQLVLSGTYRHRGGPPGNLVRVRANGQRDLAYAPQLYAPGTVSRLVEQPGLGLVLAGSFDLVNSWPAPGLARLLPLTNQVDTAFSRRVPRLDILDRLAVQPPGNQLLLTGFFAVNEQSASGLLRLTADGRLDTLFRRRPNGYTTPGLAVQADGRILVSGSLGNALSGRGVARLLPNGDYDPSFVPPAATNSLDNYIRLLAQPDGRVVLLGTGRLARLLADGRADPTFQPTALNNFANLLIDDAALQPNGRLTLCGQMPPDAANARNNVVRLLPSGRLDSSLVNILALPAMRTRVLAYRPDGRLLLGGYSYDYSTNELGLQCYLPSGLPDPAAPRLPGVGSVASLLLASTGQVLVGGNFLQANSLSSQHTSLLALAAGPALAAASPAATGADLYPNPAHGQVHLRLEATRQPRQVCLLDVLGRLVLTQTLTQPAATLTLNTATLPVGTYLLRIEYAAGSPSTRRLVLE